MTLCLKRATLPAVALAIGTLLAAAPAGATKVMDLEAAQLIQAAGFVRDWLRLTPNQQTLYQQMTTKSQTMLRPSKPARTAAGRTSAKCSGDGPLQGWGGTAQA